MRAKRAQDDEVEVSQSRYVPAQCPRCGDRYESAAKYCQRDGARLISGDIETDRYLGRELLGQFRIEEVIGAGGMGTVYRARQPSLDRDVAIKILHAELAGDPDAVRRFQREARVATALDHPNVVRVLLLGQLDDGSLYLVMEHLSGRSLSEVARHEGAMPVERALHLGLQVCDGVGEAHAHGVVHRDVKPENVMVVQRGRDRDFVKVLDFGIARLLWGEQTMATQSGVIFGTARYISPEGASGEPTDARSDVYSIAVLLYQLMAGETPFDGDSPVTLLLKHVHDRAPDIREKVAVPDPIAGVIMRALHKKPRERYADAAAFGAALREAAVRSGLVLGAASGASMPPSAGAGSPGAWPPRDAAAGAVGASPAGAPLAQAPSPFHETETGATPPPRRFRLGPVATVMLAFLLGASAVTAGALLVAWAMRGPADGPVAEQPAAGEGAPAAATDPSGDAGAKPFPGAGDEVVDVIAGSHSFTRPVRASVETTSDAEPERAEPRPSRRSRARRRAPPVTTVRPGPADSGDTDNPVFAPAVQEGVDEIPDPEVDLDGPADADAGPPWGGTLL